MDIIDIIGFNGPLIITFLTASELINQQPYLISFLCFNFINIKLNEFLKICFREPRPEKINLAQEQQKNVMMIFYKNSDAPHVNSAHIYGMPSGHAQTAAFALGFLYFVKKITPIFMLECFVLMITLYQRWSTRKHTVQQLFIGSLVGITFAGMVYYGTKNFLYSKIKFNDMTDFILHR